MLKPALLVSVVYGLVAVPGEATSADDFFATEFVAAAASNHALVVKQTAGPNTPQASDHGRIVSLSPAQHAAGSGTRTEETTGGKKVPGGAALADQATASVGCAAEVRQQCRLCDAGLEGARVLSHRDDRLARRTSSRRLQQLADDPPAVILGVVCPRGSVRTSDPENGRGCSSASKEQGSASSSAQCRLCKECRGDDGLYSLSNLTCHMCPKGGLCTLGSSRTRFYG